MVTIKQYYCFVRVPTDIYRKNIIETFVFVVEKQSDFFFKLYFKTLDKILIKRNKLSVNFGLNQLVSMELKMFLLSTFFLSCNIT